MKYSAFEQAAAEASYGVKEVDSQMEQLRAQIGQLQSKRDLLYALSSQLLSLQPEGPGSPSSGRASETVAEAAKSGQPRTEREAETAGSARSLREGWFHLGSNAGAADSGPRGGL